jgi:hypothetical protein
MLVYFFPEDVGATFAKSVMNWAWLYRQAC